ncbi:DNA-methyltransferase [Undibacterium sp. Di26W]|uniref:DNA-methyltransferase n=1 Tax=Undibacterium sp. Di26W TaxID=3413035 RepID=UPI003BF12640
MNKIFFGDCRDTLRTLAARGVQAQMCVTSPPYFGLRDYGVDGQIGLEETPERFIANLVEVFRCVRDVLTQDGTLWVNIGDSYAAGKVGRTDAGRNLGGGGNKLGSGNPGGGVPRKPSDGFKSKDLIGIPWMLAFALRADGWYLRQDIIWHKPNPMPESVTDRCTKAHEYVFLLSKTEQYFYDHEAVKEPAKGIQSGTGVGWNKVSDTDPRDSRGMDRGRSKRDSFKREDSKRAQAIPGQLLGTHRPDRAESEYPIDKRNRRSVWTIATKPYKGAHFATFPPALVEPCILAGSRPGDIVLDPFIGSGTTAEVALRHGRKFIGCELNQEYEALQDKRIYGDLI